MFLNDEFEEALNQLLFAVEEKELAVLTGEIGSGKTLLSRALIDRIDRTAEIALITNPRLTPAQFLEAIAVEFGIKRPAYAKSNMSRQIEDRPGGLADKLEAIAEVGDNLEFMVALRNLNMPETGVLLLSPLHSESEERAAQRGGLTKWTTAHEVGDRDNWLWRISWHGNRAYGFGYGCRKDTYGLRLFTSGDGKTFTRLIDKVDVETCKRVLQRVIENVGGESSGPGRSRRTRHRNRE